MNVEANASTDEPLIRILREQSAVLTWTALYMAIRGLTMELASDRDACMSDSVPTPLQDYGNADCHTTKFRKLYKH